MDTLGKPEMDAMAPNVEEWPNRIGFQTIPDQLTPVQLEVTGNIPLYAAGVLYRNGPGGYEVPTTPTGPFKISHWFDGFGQTHRFLLKEVDGRISVWYNSRSQVDDLIEQIRKTGKFHTYTFAQKRDPCSGIFGKVMTAFKPLDTSSENMANVNVTVSTNSPGFQKMRALGSEENEKKGPIEALHLKTDCNFIKYLDPSTLAPIGLTKQEILHPSLTGPLSAAHSKSDPLTGDIYNFNLDCRGRYPTYRVFHVSASTGETSILASISGPGIYAAYLHSLFLSEDFVILCIWNSHISYNGLSVLWNMNVLDALCPLDPNIAAKWFVVDRKHGRGLVAEFESPAFFAFHTVNAWQKPNEEDKTKIDIVCSLIEYPDLDIIHKLYYDVLLSTPTKEFKGVTSRSRLASYALQGIRTTPLDLTAKNRIIPKAELVTSMPNIGELPMFHPAYRLRRLRYIYTVIDRGYSTLFDGLCKIDLETKKRTFWDNPWGHTPGEAIFVPDPEGSKEDDGVLLSVVLDGGRGRSYLACLDARDLREIGRAECRGVVGFGFHGCHVNVAGESVEF